MLWINKTYRELIDILGKILADNILKYFPYFSRK